MAKTRQSPGGDIMTTLTTAARNAACNAVVDLLDIGATNPQGQAVFRTAANAAVATLALSNPAYGAAATGVATASAITSDTNAAGGTTTHLTMEDRNAAEVFQLTVTGTGGGGDIELSGGTVVTAGTTVSITSLTHTQPA